MQLSPRELRGSWDAGFTLDLHVQRSEYIGENDQGHAQFATTRTEMGELVYRLKYRGDQAAVVPIARAAANFVRDWNPGVDLIVPVPPNKNRGVQPLFQIADEIGRLLNLPVDKTSLRKTKASPELKNVDHAKRIEILVGAHSAQAYALRGRRVLLFDDLYQTGATLNAIGRLLRESAGVFAVFAVALTRARS